MCTLNHAYEQYRAAPSDATMEHLLAEVRDYTISMFAAEELTDRAEEVDDIAQTVATQVWRSLDKFKGDSKFSTYVHRIAMNARSNHLRCSWRNPVERYPELKDNKGPFRGRTEFPLMPRDPS